MRLSFNNITLELNFFNMQEQPSYFDDVEFSTINSIEECVFNYDFDDMFIAEYESFLIDDELEYNVFEFDDLCSAVVCLLIAISEFDRKSISLPTLELKPLPDSLKYVFLSLIHI